ncbi:AhpC/TSA family protein [Rhodococcus erythropolis]|uniref:AhpC/TSA family protein n=1 Tax=Rhodococcus erythropolis TaxID=1833 RepID=UPI003555CBF7
MTPASVIANHQLLTERHVHTRLKDFWADGSTLIIFIRHFGSTFAREQARALDEIRSDLASREITPVLVGMGNARDAAVYRDVTKTTVPVLVDESRVLYRRLGFRSISLLRIHLVDIRQWATSTAKGLALTSRVERRQLGGAILVDQFGHTRGIIRFTRRSDRIDSATLDSLVPRRSPAHRA